MGRDLRVQNSRIQSVFKKEKFNKILLKEKYRAHYREKRGGCNMVDGKIVNRVKYAMLVG